MELTQTPSTSRVVKTDARPTLTGADGLSELTLPQRVAAAEFTSGPVAKKLAKAKTDPFTVLDDMWAQVGDYFELHYGPEMASKIVSKCQPHALWGKNFTVKETGELLPFTQASFETALGIQLRKHFSDQNYVTEMAKRFAPLLESMAVVHTLEAMIRINPDPTVDPHWAKGKVISHLRGSIVANLQIWSSGVLDIAASALVLGELNRQTRIKAKAEAKKAKAKERADAEALAAAKADASSKAKAEPATVKKDKKPKPAAYVGNVDPRSIVKATAGHADAEGGELRKAHEKSGAYAPAPPPFDPIPVPVDSGPSRPTTSADPVNWYIETFNSKTCLFGQRGGNRIRLYQDDLGEGIRLVVSGPGFTEVFSAGEDVYSEPDWLHEDPPSDDLLGRVYVTPMLIYLPATPKPKDSKGKEKAGDDGEENTTFTVAKLEAMDSAEVVRFGPVMFWDQRNVTVKKVVSPKVRDVLKFMSEYKYKSICLWTGSFGDQILGNPPILGGSAPAPDADELAERLGNTGSRSTDASDKTTPDAKKAELTSTVRVTDAGETKVSQALKGMTKRQLAQLAEYLNDVNAKSYNLSSADQKYKDLLGGAAESVLGKKLSDFFTKDGSLKKEEVINYIASFGKAAAASLAKAGGALIGACEHAAELDPLIAGALEAISTMAANSFDVNAGPALGISWQERYRSAFTNTKRIQACLTARGMKDMSSLAAAFVDIFNGTWSMVPDNALNFAGGTSTTPGGRSFRHNVELILERVSSPPAAIIDKQFADLISALKAGDSAVLSNYMKSVDPTVSSLSAGALMTIIRPNGGMDFDYGTAKYMAVNLIKMALNCLPAPGNNSPGTINSGIRLDDAAIGRSATYFPGVRNQPAAGAGVTAFYTSYVNAARYLAGVANVWDPAVTVTRWDVNDPTGVILIPVKTSESLNSTAYSIFTAAHFAHISDSVFGCSYATLDGTSYIAGQSSRPYVNSTIYNRQQTTVLFVNVDSLQVNTLPVLSIGGIVVPFEGAGVNIVGALFNATISDTVAAHWQSTVDIFNDYYGTHDFQAAMREIAPRCRGVAPFKVQSYHTTANYPSYANWSCRGVNNYVRTDGASTFTGPNGAATSTFLSQQSATCHGLLPTELSDPELTAFNAATAVMPIGYSWPLINRAAKVIRLPPASVPKWASSAASCALTANMIALYSKYFWFGQAGLHGIDLNLMYFDPANAPQRAEANRLQVDDFSHWRRLITGNAELVFNIDNSLAWSGALTRWTQAPLATPAIFITSAERAGLFGGFYNQLPMTNIDSLSLDETHTEKLWIAASNATFYRFIDPWHTLASNMMWLSSYYAGYSTDNLGNNNVIPFMPPRIRIADTGAIEDMFNYLEPLNNNLVFVTYPGSFAASCPVNFARWHACLLPKLLFRANNRAATSVDMLIPQATLSIMRQPPSVGVITDAY